MKSISVYICDDHQLMIDGLSSILESISGIEVVGNGSNGKEALEWLQENTTEIMLLDINMPVMDGLTACKEIGLKHPEVKIIFLSMHNQIDIIQTIVDSGAKGYLLKNSGRDIVEDAINEVYSGRHYFDEKIFQAKFNYTQKPALKLIPKISKREMEVLDLITKEYTSIEIGELLFISPGTVDTHRRNLISKLDVKNTAGLVRVAIEHKLI